VLLSNAAIRRWQWLFLFTVVGIVVVSPVVGAANTDFLPTETCEYENDGEDAGVEFFDLIAPPTSGPLVLSPGLEEQVSNDLVENNLIFTAVTFQRGPPLC